jgi:putative FmdB family regulatory protein
MPSDILLNRSTKPPKTRLRIGEDTLVFMPIYEYQCKKCGSLFEKRQSVSDEPLKECEKCGGELEKQWSLSGFQFKGAGWYVTDYASKKDGGKSEKSSSPQSTTKTDTASNVKSDAPAAGSGSKKD